MDNVAVHINSVRIGCSDVGNDWTQMTETGSAYFVSGPDTL